MSQSSQFSGVPNQNLPLNLMKSQSKVPGLSTSWASSYRFVRQPIRRLGGNLHTCRTLEFTSAAKLSVLVRFLKTTSDPPPVTTYIHADGVYPRTIQKQRSRWSRYDRLHASSSRASRPRHIPEGELALQMAALV
jgi:hypothetical protein